MQKITSKIFTNRLSKYLVLLYFLNVNDWACTKLLVDTGKFMEVNPIMLPFIDSNIFNFILKAIIPLILVLVVNRRANNATKNQLKIGTVILGIAVGVYTAINILHLFNFVFLFVVF